MNEVVVTIAGNVAGEVRHRITSTGLPVTSFRLASTPRRRDASGAWTDRATSFFTVTCWRALADNVATSLVKGQPVLVVGRLNIEPWEREDRSGLEVTITADAVGHDLTKGRAEFRKVARLGTVSAHRQHDPSAEDATPPPSSAAVGEECGPGESGPGESGPDDSGPADSGPDDSGPGDTQLPASRLPDSRLQDPGRLAHAVSW